MCRRFASARKLRRRVQVQTNGLSHVREFSVKRLGAEKAWRQATRFLAECRGYIFHVTEWRGHISNEFLLLPTFRF